jgi:hypothetical protein
VLQEGTIRHLDVPLEISPTQLLNPGVGVEWSLPHQTQPSAIQGTSKIGLRKDKPRLLRSGVVVLARALFYRDLKSITWEAFMQLLRYYCAVDLVHAEGCIASR